jgi:hypothetical protein
MIGSFFFCSLHASPLLAHRHRLSTQTLTPPWIAPMSSPASTRSKKRNHPDVLVSIPLFLCRIPRRFERIWWRETQEPRWRRCPGRASPRARMPGVQRPAGWARPLCLMQRRHISPCTILLELYCSREPSLPYIFPLQEIPLPFFY